MGRWYFWSVKIGTLTNNLPFVDEYVYMSLQNETPTTLQQTRRIYDDYTAGMTRETSGASSMPIPSV